MTKEIPESIKYLLLPFTLLFVAFLVVVLSPIMMISGAVGAIFNLENHAI